MQCEPQLREEQAIEILIRNIRGAIAPYIRGFEIKTFEVLLAKVTALQSVVPDDFMEPRPPRGDKVHKVRAVQVAKPSLSTNKAKAVATTDVIVNPKPSFAKLTFKEKSSKAYSFHKDAVLSIFHLLMKNGLILPEPKRPEQVDWVDNPRYCPFHRFVGHTLEDCFVFKDMVEDKIQNKKLVIAQKYMAAKPTVHMVQGGQQRLVPSSTTANTTYHFASCHMIRHTAGVKEPQSTDNYHDLIRQLQIKDEQIEFLKYLVTEKDKTIDVLTTQLGQFTKVGLSPSLKDEIPEEVPKEKGKRITTIESTPEPKPITFTHHRPTKAERNAKVYSFKKEAIRPLFNNMMKKGLQLPEKKRPSEANMVDHPLYCSFHQCVGHKLEDCFAFKDLLEDRYQKKTFQIAKRYLSYEGTTKSKINKGKGHKDLYLGFPIGLYCDSSDLSEEEQIIQEPPDAIRNDNEQYTTIAATVKLTDWAEQLHRLRISEVDTPAFKASSTYYN